MRINYINLTNGIEALPDLPEGFRFIRIQSSILERKMWNRMIQDLDYDFLLNAAIGNECVIYDFGARKPVPRAVYQGVEFIKYVLHKRWLNEEYLTDCNKSGKSDHIRCDCNSYFESCYKELCRANKKKIDYFKPYIVGKINIRAVTSGTSHDGDKDFYRKILLREAI